jgi:glycerophosphoryl diester phosphodiesterase
MISALPKALLHRPIAHRGLHDRARNVPENSLPAVQAAIMNGYGIEVDLQLSSDGEAMVFHDRDLLRLTGTKGKVNQTDAEDMASLKLIGGQGARIPRLTELLATVAGRAPILIELKDRDGSMGRDVGLLETAVARALAGYHGDVAVMSFNPHSIAAMAHLAPRIPRGLVTSGFRILSSSLLRARRTHLRDILDFERVGASFVSHDARDLARPRLRSLREAGVPVLCWTIRSRAEEIKARALADNITFEGYKAEIPD